MIKRRNHYAFPGEFPASILLGKGGEVEETGQSDFVMYYLLAGDKQDKRH
jgi:hypothetical protein